MLGRYHYFVALAQCFPFFKQGLATFTHNRQTFIDVNPKARRNEYRISEQINITAVAPDGNIMKGLSSINRIVGNAHAEIGAMNQSLQANNQRGHGNLVVLGDPICKYCGLSGDIRKMGLELWLDSLTIEERATGTIRNYYASTGDFYNLVQGGKNWNV